MDCRTAKFFTEQQASGQLAPSDADALTAHLAECDACGQEAAFLTRIDQSLGSFQPVKAPASLRRKVFEVVDPDFGVPKIPWRKWLFRLTLAPVAAMALMMIFIPDMTWATWAEGLKSTQDMDLSTLLHVGAALFSRTPPTTVAIIVGSLVLLLVYLRESFFTE
jgi:anti-sigma factor RsiW